MDRKGQAGTVRRITVDERLSEDLIRLEICELISNKIDGSGEFKDEPDFWKGTVEEGEEILARPITLKESNENTYTNLMSIPESQVEEFPWKDLKEGQVFLSGEFKVKKTKIRGKEVTRYFISPGKKTFRQIDDDVKENTKTLYYEILSKGEKDDKL